MPAEDRRVSRRLESVCTPSSFVLEYDRAPFVIRLACKNEYVIQSELEVIAGQQVSMAQALHTPPLYQLLRYQICLGRP